MTSDRDALEFVTIEGLLSYGEALACLNRAEGASAPPAPVPSTDHVPRVHAAMPLIQTFLQRTQVGFPDAQAYEAARRTLIEDGCQGDELVFYAAWNKLLADGELSPLYRAPIGAVQKPTYRRPVAVVPRTQLTPQLVEGRLTLDLGDDGFLLLPRDLTGRTILFAMRHGISRVESKTHRVGRRLPNLLDPDQGVARADAVGAALRRVSRDTVGLADRDRSSPDIHLLETDRQKSQAPRAGGRGGW